MEHSNNNVSRMCGLIVRLRVVPRRTVVGDIDRRFDNLSGSHHQSHVNCASSVYIIYVSGQLSRDVIGCFKLNRWLSRDVIGCFKSNRWLSRDGIGCFKLNRWLSRDVIGCFKSNRWLSRDGIGCWFVKSCGGSNTTRKYK